MVTHFPLRIRWLCYVVLGIVVSSAAGTCQAQNNFFVAPGGIGNWDDIANWNAGHLPSAGETAYVHHGREVTINTAVGASPSDVRVADVNTSPVDAIVNMQPGGQLVVSGQMHLSNSGDADVYAVMNQTGGSLTVQSALFLAFNSSNSADYNLSNGSANIGNLWFRFGNATLTQTGGTMNAQNLVLGEGGTAFTSSLYNLFDGELNIALTANIGKGLGAGDSLAGSSHGSMNISGGVATFGNLLFGTDPTDLINISGSGILRVSQASYSEADALAAIAAGNIVGTNLIVRTVSLVGDPYTQVSAIPEPSSLVLLLGASHLLPLRTATRKIRRRSAI